MTGERTFQCRCGAMRWQIAPEARGMHLECYCADCQTFARHLGVADDWLDAAGGTEIFQTLPRHLTFTAGREKLAVLQLSPKGLMRWHAACCGAPIGNTLTGSGFSFVGAILRPGQTGFGPVTVRCNTASAHVPIRATGLPRAVAGALARAAAARLTGRHRQTPFFGADDAPVAQPRILTLQERNAARPPKPG